VDVVEKLLGSLILFTGQLPELFNPHSQKREVLFLVIDEKHGMIPQIE